MSNSIENNSSSLLDHKVNRRGFLKGVAGLAGGAFLSQYVDPITVHASEKKDDVILTEWQGIPLVEGETQSNGEVVRPNGGVFILDSEVNRRKEQNNVSEKKLTAAGAIFEGVVGEEDLDSTGGDASLRWTGGNLIYENGHLVEPEHAYIANNQGFFHYVEDMASLPQEVQDKYRVSADLPIAWSAFDVSRFDSLFDNVGGEATTDMQLAQSWGKSFVEGELVFEDTAVGAWQRSVASTALFAEATQEVSDVLNICSITNTQGEICNYSRYINPETGDIDVVTRFNNTSDKVNPEIYVITRFGEDKKVKGVAPATAASLSVAYGRNAPFIVQNTTAFYGDKVVEVVQGITNLDNARVFLPGMNRDSQFAPKLTSDARYMRNNVGQTVTYRAFSGDTTDYVYSPKTADWIQIPAISNEVAQSTGASNTKELGITVDDQSYPEKEVAHTIWVHDENGNRQFKANRLPYTQEWIWTQKGLGDYFKEAGMEFGIAMRGRSELGKPEDISVITQDASSITPEIAGEFRYLRKKAMRFNETTMEWETLTSGELADTYEWKNLDSVIDYATSTGKNVLFHPLIDAGGAAGRERFPDWMNIQINTDLKRLKDNPQDEALRSTLRQKYLQFGIDHVKTVVSRYKGVIKDYIVVNETQPGDIVTERPENIWETFINDSTQGIDYVESFLQAAHETDPEAELWINDWTVIYNDTINDLIDRAASLKQKGVKMDGIGIQFHTSVLDTTTTQASLEQLFGRAAQAGLKVRITELDWMHVVTEADEQKKAQMATWLIKAAKNTNARYGQTVVEGLTMWGYRDDMSWLYWLGPEQGGKHPLLYEVNGDQLETGSVYQAMIDAIQSS